MGLGSRAIRKLVPVDSFLARRHTIQFSFRPRFHFHLPFPHLMLPRRIRLHSPGRPGLYPGLNLPLTNI